MFVIVGLGNPDKKYEHTRHNVGFDVLSVLSEKLRIPINKARCKSLVGEGAVGGEKVVLAAPQTYMNLSGEAVVQLMNWYKIDSKRLIVVYDDIDLDKGRLRVRASGSAGTHNGMRSVIAEIGTSAFARIRIGIRDAEVNIPIMNYVLSEVKREDYNLFIAACGKAADAALEIASGEPVEKVMTAYNG